MAASADGRHCTAAPRPHQPPWSGGQHPAKPTKGQQSSFSDLLFIGSVFLTDISEEPQQCGLWSFPRKGRLDLFNRMLLHGSTSAHSTSRQERGKGRCDWPRRNGLLWLVERQDRAGKRLGAKHSYSTSSYLPRASPTHDINSNRILCSSHCFGTTTKIAKVEVGIQFMGLAVCPFLNLLTYKILRPQF